MRISSVELTPYALPFARPYVTARGRLERREMILVRLRVESGEQGLGEAVPLSLRGGSSLAEVMADLELCREQLEGAELGGGTLLGRCRATGACAPALAAIDVALIDLAARLAERPVWSLLGADDPGAVRCNATLVAGAPDQVAADALAWAQRGFESFKLKIGGGGGVIETVTAVREALGPEAALRIDANAVWSVSEAIDTVRSLEPQRLEFVEQPCATLEELAEVRAAVSTKIVADESVTSAADARRGAELGAADATTVKLAKVGGTAAARAIADAMPAFLSSALDGPVGIAAAAHLATTLPGAPFAHGLATQLLFSEWPATRSVALESGDLRPSHLPGLGVELDEDALARLTVDVS
jgi:o-succinylbenzoate synthase